MTYEIKVTKIERKRISKRDYREVGKHLNGEPEYKNVVYEVEDDVRSEVLDIKLDDFCMGDFLVWLSTPRATYIQKGPQP